MYSGKILQTLAKYYANVISELWLIWSRISEQFIMECKCDLILTIFNFFYSHKFFFLKLNGSNYFPFLWRAFVSSISFFSTLHSVVTRVITTEYVFLDYVILCSTNFLVFPQYLVMWTSFLIIKIFQGSFRILRKYLVRWICDSLTTNCFMKFLYDFWKQTQV